MFSNYITAVVTSKLTSKKNKVVKGVNNWYEYCGIIIKKMIPDNEIVPGATNVEREKTLNLFLIQHIAEELMMLERIELMNYLEENSEIETRMPAIILTNTTTIFQKYQTTTKEKVIEDNKTRIKNHFSEFMKIIREYLYSKIIVLKRSNSSRPPLKALVIFNGPSSLYNDDSNNGNLNVFIQRDRIWVPAEAEDKRELESVIKKKYKLTSSDHLNRFVGFIGFESNKQYMTFKIKDTTEERNTSFRCDQSGKNGIIDRLNDIEKDRIEEQRFIKKDPKKTKEENANKTIDGAFELCIREEFTLRSFQKEEDVKTSKATVKTSSKLKIVWFLDTETAVYNEFEKREKMSK